MIVFRDYQEFAIQSIFDYFEEHDGNPLIVMPTGTGKSLVIAGLVHTICRQYPGQRIIKLTHVKELIEQNFKALLKVWPTAPAGIYSAGLKKKQIRQVTFAGIASVASKAEDFGHIDLVIIDEAHLLSPKDGTRYQLFLNGLKERNPYLKIIGLTATHYRMGQGLLTENGLFTDVSVDMANRTGFNWFIDEGYLSLLVPKKTAFELDIDGVQIQQGDYNQKQLQEKVDKTEITEKAIEEAVSTATDRDHWLVFASGIEHTEHVAELMNARGVRTTYVHSKQSGSERDQNIAAFKRGEYTAMVNNGILTTGFDYPDIDVIVVLRPTRSASLWVQLLGRGTRPVYADGYDLSTTSGRLEAIAHGGKKNCLVLDFAGNTKRLGPVNDPILPSKKKKKGGGEAPVKVCPHCMTYNHASARFCISCGEEFPKTNQLQATYSEEDLVVREAPIIEFINVTHVTYQRHTKTGKPPSLKASYYAGIRKFDVWYCFEHTGLPRKTAREWWRNNTGNEPPESIDNALLRLQELRTPKRIRVWFKKQHSEVLGCEYEPR